MSGSLIAQLLAICVSPIMTRIYTEEQIGEYTLILTAVSMFGSVICGRYDLSIVSEPKNENVFPLIKLSFIVTLVLSAVVSLGYTIYYVLLEETTLNYLSAFFWIFVLLLFTGIGQILISYNNRCQEYSLMTSVQIVREVGRDLSLIVLGLFKTGVFGLLISQCLSVFLGLKRQATGLQKEFGKVIHCTNKQLREVGRIHKNQLLYSVLASFANSFSYSALNLFVSSLFGVKELAYYSMSFRMLGLPLQLLSVNVSKVFFENASRDYDKKGSFRKVFVQTSLLLSLCSIVMVFVLMLWAPSLFKIFFGEGWEQAGVYVRYLAPMFGIRLVVGALTPTITICKKQNWELTLQVLFLLSAVLCYSLARNQGSIKLFLIAISVTYSIVYLIYYIVMLKLSEKKEN